MELWETGLNRIWVYNELPKAQVCLTNVKRNHQQQAPQTPIKLVDLTSAFFVLGIGISLSFLAFIVELMVLQRLKNLGTN